MHKRRVITLFSLLVLFSAALFIFQIFRFGSITGYIAEDSVERSDELDFGVRVTRLSVNNEQLVADVAFSSDKPITVLVNTYALNNGNVVDAKADTIVVKDALNYQFKMNLPQDSSGKNQFIIYATDGISDIKLLTTVPVKSFVGRTIDAAEENPLYTGVAFLIGCCILLIVIFAGIIINKHNNESTVILPSLPQKRFIELR
jgi:hypothetical protein